MTILDYSVIIIAVTSVVAGAATGLVRSSLMLVATVLGVLLAIHFYRYGAALLRLVMDDARLANLLGFAGILTLVLVAGAILSHLLRRALHSAGLTWLDRLLGAGAGLARGWLVASAIYLGLMAFPIKFEAVQNATLAPYLAYGAQTITYAASSEMRSKFLDTYRKLQARWNKQERSSRQ